MPFKISEDTREITKKIGKQSLTLTYKPGAYSSAKQASFTAEYQMAGRKCPSCGARIPLEEIPEGEKEVYRKRGHTNGHVMQQRALVCAECNEPVDALQTQVRLMADWLSDHLTEADWEDDRGQIPLDAQALLERVPFELMMTAFNMIQEDKQGKV